MSPGSEESQRRPEVYTPKQGQKKWNFGQWKSHQTAAQQSAKRRTAVPYEQTMVTRHDVIAAYRFFLGRDPENDQAVENVLSNHTEIHQLRESFLQRPEFEAISANFVLEHRFPLDREQTSGQIEVSGSVQQLEELRGLVEQAWNRLGQEEPYWSVSTYEGFKLDQFEKNQDRYWNSCQGDVERMKSWLSRNGITLDPDWECLEYGCGTGRMTRWLTKEFHKVIACDISPPHLNLARKALTGHRVDFIRIAGLAMLDQLPEFDLLVSIIVLQHNPPPIIAYVLDRLLARIRPGGFAYFQVPTFRRGYSFDVKRYLDPSSGSGQDMEMHVLPQRYIFDLARKHHCNLVEVEPDNMVGTMDTISTTFLLQKSTEGA